jgi:phosphatidylinositol alpha-1,6-mannosyltransferase
MLLIVVNLLFVVYAIKVIKKRSVTVILSGSADLVLAAWILSIISGKQFVVAVHGNDFVSKEIATIFGFWKKKVVLPLLKKAVMIMSNSNFNKNNLEKAGIDGQRITVVNPCISEGKIFVDKGLRQIFRAKINSSNKKVILSVGRLVKRKGHDNVLRALKKITVENDDIVYAIVGKGENEDELIELTEKLGLQEKVKFLKADSEEDLNGYYNACDLFVMISRKMSGDLEGFGIVYLEANACMKPVIAGRSGGVIDAVADGETGILVEPEDTNAIAEAIHIFINDSEYAEKIGRQGYDRVKKMFMVENMKNSIMKVFDKDIYCEGK